MSSLKSLKIIEIFEFWFVWRSSMFNPKFHILSIPSSHYRDSYLAITLKTLTNWSVSFTPGNKGFLKRSSAIIHPKAKMSIFSLYFSFSRISGLLYHLVDTYSVSLSLLLRYQHKPKSPIFTVLFNSNRFSGLMSLCTNPFQCK